MSASKLRPGLRLRQAYANVRRVNPVLALALLAAAGLAATRLPRLQWRDLPSLDLVLAGGLPLVLAGLLFGPIAGVLDGAALRALAPVTALGIGWIGAAFGARFEWRFVRHIPRGVWQLLAVQAAAVFVAVGAAAWGLARLFPGLQAAWVPPLPAILTLAAVAVVSGPGAVALVARAAGGRRVIAHAFGLAAALDALFGALAFTLALALYHPRQPVGGVALGFVTWLAIALGSGALTGMLFLSLTRLYPARADLGFWLLGVMLFGAGVGYAADLSPFFVCALAAAVIVNLSDQRRAVLRLLEEWEHPVYAVFLILVGALLVLPSAWVFLAVPVLAALRVAVRWAVGRFALRRFPAGHWLPRDLGLATVAQGGIALALGLNFYLTYGGAGAAPVLTTVALCVLVAQLAAPPLLARALRPPPAAPPPQASAPVPLTSPPPPPELRA
jgi:hypothetical protein